jgi:hypothetical protein
MFNVGQEVTVITEKGVAYTGFIMARATSDDGQKAYKIAIEGVGLSQLGQWHRACDVFVLDPQGPPETEVQDYTKSILRN